MHRDGLFIWDYLGKYFLYYPLFPGSPSCWLSTGARSEQDRVSLAHSSNPETGLGPAGFAGECTTSVMSASKVSCTLAFHQIAANWWQHGRSGPLLLSELAKVDAKCSTLSEGSYTSNEHMRGRLVTGGAGIMSSILSWQQPVQKPEAWVPSKYPWLGCTLLLKPGQVIFMAFSELRNHCMPREAAAAV